MRYRASRTAGSVRSPIQRAARRPALDDASGSATGEALRPGPPALALPGADAENAGPLRGQPAPAADREERGYAQARPWRRDSGPAQRADGNSGHAGPVL